MALSVLLKSIISSFLLPPGSLILLLALAFSLRHRAPKFSLWLSWSTLLALYLLSTPLMSNALASRVELKPSLDADTRATAIVVLGGGKRFGALDRPEGETINNVTLSRVRYAAQLHRLHQLPILVSGGSPLGGESEAKFMQHSLQNDFNVNVAWLESGSNDSADNASQSAKLLLPQHKNILLVSSADHLPRAIRSFEKAGFTVFPQPTDYHHHETFSILSFVPRAKNLATSSNALRELLGQTWYQLRNI
ncbi:YdcF family protein [Deefgea piscis]|uniref:YdcF family protein n=1 Tax=Deefgea piscis TaxID=2739061 RepID=UPI001C825A02|nr:YdcF family protein [Deefgea piscis]QZA80425.1 YdcF family protein [Deefgea piscis]